MICSSCGASSGSDFRFCGYCGARLGSEPSASEATRRALDVVRERRLASVLFVDLVGFTSLAERLDAEDVQDLQQGYFDAAKTVIARYDGTVEKFIGDAVMVLWGVPRAHEDDAGRAVLAALELIEAVVAFGKSVGLGGLTARGGIATGEVAANVAAVDQLFVAGDVVNTASRLQTSAAPGTVVVDAATARAARRLVAFEESGPLPIRGKKEPVRTFRAVGPAGGEVDASGDEPPLIGREAELASLHAALASAITERRSVLAVVAGPAGVGKSRLLAELERARPDVRWMRASGGFAAALGSGDPITALIGTAVDTRAVPAEHDLPAWRLVLEEAASHGPMGLVIDDLQLADPRLAELLEHLREWARAPLLLIAAGRSDAVASWRPGATADVRLELAPLSSDAMRALIAAMVPALTRGRRAEIVERAAGLPLYAVELVRMLRDQAFLVVEGGVLREAAQALPSTDLPESLQALIADRIDGLDAQLRTVLRDASVLGQTFASAALAAVAELDSAAMAPTLAELMRRRLLVPVSPSGQLGATYRFGERLVREVAYVGLTRRQRRARHLNAARYYDSLGDRRLRSLVGDHVFAAIEASTASVDRAQLVDWALGALIDGADVALAEHNPASALRSLNKAARLATDVRQRLDLHRRAASAAIANADADAADRHARAALALAVDVGDDQATADASRLLGVALLLAYRVDEAIETLEAAISGWSDPVTPEAAALAAELASAYLIQERDDEALTWAERALGAAQVMGLPELAADALDTKGSALQSLGRMAEGVTTMREAIASADRRGATFAAVRARQRLAVALLVDDPREALATARRAMDVARGTGSRDRFLRLAGVAVEAALDTGDWDWALEVVAEFDNDDLPIEDRVDFSGVASIIGALRGMTPDASDSLSIEAVTDGGLARALHASRQAQVALATGAADEGLRLANEAVAGLRHAGYRTAAREGWAPACRAAGWARDVKSLLAALGELEAETGGRWLAAALLTFRAAAAALAGDSPRAAQLFDGAAEVWVELDLPLPTALCHVDAAIHLPLDVAPHHEEMARANLAPLGASGAVDRILAGAHRARERTRLMP